MKHFFLTALLLSVVTLTCHAQRKTDQLSRGLVAVPATTGGTLVSWRILGEEYYDTEYNVYRNGTKLNATPLKVSTYVDSSTDNNARYQVEAIVRGVAQPLSPEAKRWANGYFDIMVSPVVDREGNDVTGEYFLNDVSLADVNGDGVVEFIVKRNYGGDILNAANKTKFHHLECYTLSGERLWWIDCGPNLMAGPDEQWDIVGFDWDQDGKAELVMRGADNMILHLHDGTTLNIGNMNYYAPRDEYTHQGAEYLLYMEGETCRPYAWNGSGNSFTPMAYPLPRFEAGEAANPLNATSAEYEAAWGKADTGHRSSKHYFGAPFLDGRKASIFLGRGCYTRHKMCAFDVDPLTHALTQVWRWDNNSGWSSPWYGNGFHNFQIADVDWDGRDEIVFGSMVIDDNGTGLCTTGNGHGDAQHCSDLDPYRHGQEQFTCNEDEPACTYYNATTGQIYYRLKSTSDDGRALCGNFSNSFPGSLGRTTQSGLVSTVADKVIQGGPATGTANDALYWSHLNQRIYWDGDLLDEVMDSPGSEARDAAVYKPGGGRLFTSTNCNTNNSSKNNPGALADIFGDWREELVMRAENNTRLRICVSGYPTTYGLYTLWHDHQYRNAMVWQSMGYNQPPHKSYFVGELEGITIAPPPFTMTGRTEIANGGTISAAHADQHVMVCETGNTTIQVADGANPYIATFNVPSHVQGTNSPLLNGKAVINYQYFTCDVKGGAFTGDMRLVKQGDGILNLPKVDEAYTGSTDIWAGTVNFDGTMRQSKVWMNRFAELNSDGGEFKQLEMNYDAKLRPGRAENKGSVTIAEDLKLGFGSRIIFDIYNDGFAADFVKAKKLTIETKDWQYGPKYLTPVFEFVSHKGSGDDFALGRYLIGEFESIEGDLSKITIEGLGTTHKTNLIYEDGKLYLDIAGVRDAGTVVWNGLQNSVWDMASTSNFTSATDESVTDEIFVTGDKVIFNDNSTRLSVDIIGDIEADSVIVDNTKSYVFAGNGKLVGNTTLVKRGTGTLTIKGDHSYIGGTRLSGGKVIITSLANENQAMGALGGVVTSSQKFIIENGATLSTTAAVSNGSPIMIYGEEGAVINNSADFVVNKLISGTKLTKSGGGWMKLNVNNPTLGRLVINGGVVQCVSCSTPAKVVEFVSGTLSENTGSSYEVNVPEGGTGIWNTVDNATYTNKVTGSGTLTLYCSEIKGTSWFATRTQLAQNFSEFKGTIKATGRTDDSGARWTLNTASGMPQGTLDIASGLEVQNTGKTFTVGKLAGTGKLGGYASFSSSGGSAANTWQAGNDEDFTWGGTVVGNSLFNKLGTGKMTVTGKWTNTGAVAVKAGEMVLRSGAQLGTGLLTVDASGTLSMSTGASNLFTNSSLSVRGILKSATSNSGYTSSSNMNEKNITFYSASRYVVVARQCATNSSNGCSSLKNVGRLTMNGTIEVQLYNSRLEAGDSIRIWEASTMSGTPKFDLPELGDGLTWDTSRIKEGLLFVVSTSGIRGLEAGELTEPTDIYNVRGQLIRRKATTLKGLPAGIYFRKGEKFVIQ